MERRTLIDMADGARLGNASALARFKVVAKAAGYEGRPGGWIFAPGGADTRWHGWQAMATDIARGRAPAVISAILAANTPAQARTAVATTGGSATHEARQAKRATAWSADGTSAMMERLRDAPTQRPTLGTAVSAEQRAAQLMTNVTASYERALAEQRHPSAGGSDPATLVVVVAHIVRVAPFLTGADRGAFTALCRKLVGGTVAGPAADHLTAVDCLACLDAYTELTRPGDCPPVTNGSLGLAPTRL